MGTLALQLTPKEWRALRIIAQHSDALFFDLSVPRLLDLGLVEQPEGRLQVTEQGRALLAEARGSEEWRGDMGDMGTGEEPPPSHPSHGR